MSRKLKMCGDNHIDLPQTGCSDCEELAYRIKQLEDWVDNPLSAEDIVELTPLECYEPPCADSRVCYGTTCCMKVGCE